MRWMYLELAGAVAMAIWLYLLLGRGQFWRMREALPPCLVPGGAPSVVAVIPARNEAPVVGRAIASLAQQEYPGEFHIVLSDDASDDATALAARDAASTERLTVIRAGPLPDGWTGKMWAVAAGVQAADRLHPEYLLLTDADIVHAPDNLAGLVARAQSGGGDLVSYMVKLECRTLAEQALIPAFVFFFFMLYPPSHGTGAAGGCILIRRDALERAGGIWRIRGELIDDCALARAVRQSGGRVWMGLSSATRSIRGYDAGYAAFGQIGRMISRTAFAQLRYSALLLAGTVLGLTVTYLAPPLLTLLGPRGAASAMGAMAWLLMSVAYYPALRFYQRPWFWAPLLPAITLFYLGATIYSAAAYRSGTGVSWKGRAPDSAGR